MDFLSWFLTFAVVGYAAALTVKTVGPLRRYRKAEDRVVKIPGTISSFYGEEVTKRKGEVVTSFYPVYSCEVDGGRKLLKGIVRHVGAGANAVGQKVTLLYDRETKELWCERDLPLMGKQIKVRLITVAGMLALMILTSVLL